MFRGKYVGITAAVIYFGFIIFIPDQAFRLKFLVPAMIVIAIAWFAINRWENRKQRE